MLKNSFFLSFFDNKPRSYRHEFIYLPLFSRMENSELIKYYQMSREEILTNTLKNLETDFLEAKPESY